MPASVSLTPARLPVSPGAEATAEVRVRNTGTVVDRFSIEVIGEAGAWAVVTPQSVSLFPGSDEAVRVVFRPGVEAGGPVGEVAFGVRITSGEDGGFSVVEEGVLDVAPVLAVHIDLTPKTSRGGRQAVHELAVDNRGNRPVQATVTAGDPDQQLLFDIEPDAFVAGPGTATFVKVRVRPRKAFRRGPVQTRTFQVALEEAGQPLAVAQGTMVQEGTEPRWLRKALLGALAAVLLLTLLWFGLLRPTVRSAAKEAAQEAVAPPTIGPGGGGDAADGAGAGAGSGAGGASVAVGADAGGAGGAAGGTTIDGRLFLTEKGSTSFEVPAGSTLQLTDIVLQNPAGDSGPLHIRRNGTPLLVVELANFRDLDYHFVAPIVFTSGQKLELSADCTSPGCTPGAYFAGFLTRS